MRMDVNFPEKEKGLEISKPFLRVARGRFELPTSGL